MKPAIGIGKRVRQVQETFATRYGIPASEYIDAFDNLFDDDETFAIGSLEGKALHLPGHTPDHLGYRDWRYVSMFLPRVSALHGNQS